MTILKVSQLNRFVKSVLDSSPQLREVYVRGEISNLSAYNRSGHLYFSLKDADALVRAVMFAGNAAQLRFLPQDGLSVIARGTVTLYERDGSYQLYVSELVPDGAGTLGVAYEQLRRRLAAEGLFDEAKKRPLPTMPSVIGVVTSPTGAAVQDIFSVLERRYPIASVIFVPVAVQGKGSAHEVANAIRTLNADGRSEVLIVGRGGGSLEELWAFNEEETVRAVADSHIPIISAVGHETDVTLCDFAADLRAATPTAAAELAVPDRAELGKALHQHQVALLAAAQAGLHQRKRYLAQLKISPSLQDPFFFVNKNGQRLNNLILSMYNLSIQMQSGRRNSLERRAALLDSLSPLRVLARGYSITERDGRPLDSCDCVAIGEKIMTRLSDGRLISTVTAVEKEREPI